MRRLIVLCAGTCLVGVVNTLAQDAPAADCGRLVGSPNDLRRNDPGIPADKIDTSAAIVACEAAVRQYPNDALLNYQLGHVYNEAKRFQAAIANYRTAAERGYAPAQNALGGLYYNGEGVTKDYAQAVTWYR